MIRGVRNTERRGPQVERERSAAAAMLGLPGFVVLAVSAHDCGSSGSIRAHCSSLVSEGYRACRATHAIVDHPVDTVTQTRRPFSNTHSEVIKVEDWAELRRLHRAAGVPSPWNQLWCEAGLIRVACVGLGGPACCCCRS
jgi:hypothetical protein